MLAAANARMAGGEQEDRGAVELLLMGGRHWRLLTLGPLLAGAVAYGVASMLAPIFTARATILPPQQSQGGVAGALMASLGGLAGALGGAAGGIKNPSDQYVALMQSVSVQDRLIDQFNLQRAYEVEYRVDARKLLESRVRINVAKKDSLIVIDVDDEDPKRAAAMANQHVEELRRLTSTLAVTEAQRRRVFFEAELEQTRVNLAKAQAALQGSGISEAALKIDPRATASSYARVQAEIAANEIKLAAMRGALTDTSPEVRQAQTTLAALRVQLARLEQQSSGKDGDNNNSNYVSIYREFKYQEMLFELMARQYEAARVDESREGAMIQVVDAAQVPEKKSRPRRGFIALGAAVSAALLLLIGLRTRLWWQRATILSRSP